MRPWLVLVLSLSLPLACTDSSRAPDPLGGDGAAGGDGGADLASLVGDGGALDDLASNDDLAPRRTVFCGAQPCPVPAEACCTATFGVSGSCVASTGGCANLQAEKFECDGSDDCKVGDICCYHPMAGSTCVAPAGCQQIAAREMCHLDKACGGVDKCCPLGVGTPYKVCMMGPCPF